MTNIPNDIYQPQALIRTSEKSVLIVTANKTEDLEFFYPYYRFIEEGYRVDVATPDGGEFKGKHELGLKESLRISDVAADSYDLLYIPGGKAPAKLKDSDDAVAIVQEFADAGKTIAAICHGPQLLAEADVIEGVTISAWPECQAEVEDAGAHFVSQEACVDGQFITGRWPADLPAFTAKVLEALGTESTSLSATYAASSPIVSDSILN